MPLPPYIAAHKRNLLDTHGFYIHVTRHSDREAILAEGLNPDHSDLVSSISDEHMLCYAPIKKLGDILYEIGGGIDEDRLFIAVVRAETFHEDHAYPDTTHQELADAQDTLPDLERSIDELWRVAYTRPIPPEAFADHFVIKNLYNPLAGQPAEQ